MPPLSAAPTGSLNWLCVLCQAGGPCGKAKPGTLLSTRRGKARDWGEGGWGLTEAPSKVSVGLRFLVPRNSGCYAEPPGRLYLGTSPAPHPPPVLSPSRLGPTLGRLGEVHAGSIYKAAGVGKAPSAANPGTCPFLWQQAPLTRGACCPEPRPGWLSGTAAGCPLGPGSALSPDHPCWLLASAELDARMEEEREAKEGSE